jgi:dienelactone hydrolase
MTLKEKPLRFGENQRLLGILTLPETVVAGRLPVVLPNTGLDPRIGPNRLHVHVARGLAALGHPVLRMDIGGLGDSDAAVGAVANASQDLCLAFDLLSAQGLGDAFALFGNCSGAHDAYQTALADPRVKAAVLIDGYTYDTPRHARHRFIARLKRLPDKLKEWTTQQEQSAEIGPAFNLGMFQKPALPDTAHGYQTLLARGTRLAFVFSGDIAREYSYPEQHFDLFPALKGQAQVWYWPDADHTFTRRAARQRLIDGVGGWLGEGVL